MPKYDELPAGVEDKNRLVVPLFLYAMCKVIFVSVLQFQNVLNFDSSVELWVS